MAKKTKAPEQDSNPAVLSDAEIVVDNQQPKQQPDTPPFDNEALPKGNAGGRYHGQP